MIKKTTAFVLLLAGIDLLVEHLHFAKNREWFM